MNRAVAAVAIVVACALPSRARADDDARTAAAPGPDPDEIVPDRGARRAAAEANLEPVRKREGLAFGFGLGPSMQVGFGFQEASGTGGSLDLRIGTSGSDRLAWFVDLFSTAVPRDGVGKRDSSTTLTFGAQVFALETLWLRAGVGFSNVTLRPEDPTPDDPNDPLPDPVSFNGLGAIAGGGVDLLRRGRFALSGDFTFVSGAFRDGLVTAAVFQLGFTWY